MPRSKIFKFPGIAKLVNRNTLVLSTTIDDVIKLLNKSVTASDMHVFQPSNFSGG